MIIPIGKSQKIDFVKGIFIEKVYYILKITPYLHGKNHDVNLFRFEKTGIRKNYRSLQTKINSSIKCFTWFSPEIFSIKNCGCLFGIFSLIFWWLYIIIVIYDAPISKAEHNNITQLSLFCFWFMNFKINDYWLMVNWITCMGFKMGFLKHVKWRNTQDMRKITRSWEINNIYSI